MRRFSAFLAAALFAVTILAPAAADARDRRGRGYDDRGQYSERYHHRRHDRRDRRDDHGDAVAAGIIGLVLGVAIASAAQESRDRREAERYERDDRYYQRDDGYYDDRRGAYEDDYGYADEPPPPQCTRRERQWDRYANRYVTVDVPC